MTSRMRSGTAARPLVVAWLGCVLLILWVWYRSLDVALGMVAVWVATNLCLLTAWRVHVMGPWVVGIPVYYFITMLVVPSAVDAIGFYEFSQPGIVAGLVIVAIGLSSFAVALALGPVRGRSTVPHNATAYHPRGIAWEWPWNELMTHRAAALTYVAGLVGDAVALRSGYLGLHIGDVEPASWTGPLSAFGTLHTVAAWVAWWRVAGREPVAARWKWLAFVSAVTLATVGLVANSKGLLLLPVLIPLVCFALRRRRIPLAAIATAAVFYVAIAQPLVSGMRTASLVGGEDRAVVLESVVEHLATVSVAELWEMAYELRSQGLLRLTTLPELAEIVERSGHEVEHWYGDTYTHALGFLVPRALWGEKPALNVGNLVGNRYGFVYPEDVRTNVAVTQIGELYLNFGILGLIVGMFLWGWLAKVVDRLVAGRPLTWMAAPAALLIFPFQENYLAGGLFAWAKLIPVLFIWCVMLKFALVRRSGRNAPFPSATGKP